MTPDAIAVLIVLAGLLCALAFTRLPPDAVLVGGLTLLLILPAPSDGGWRLGVISVPEALSGFSNSGLATVAVLFVVVTGLRETGGVDWVAQTFLQRPRGLRRALVRLTLPVCGMSAFLNNTPVVALLIPAVGDWCKKLNIHPSKLMIPLSYAAILGGTCSLIGTSTNLVVSGLVASETGMGPLHMFDITWVGLPCTVIGILFLIIVGPRLLPERGSVAGVLSDPREYTLEMLVPEGSSLAGRTVEQAGLRNLPGCFLVEVERGDEIIPAVTPEQVLQAGDRLLFAGVVESIRDLQNQRGLALPNNQVFKLDSPRYRRRLFESVISDSSPVVGRTIKESRFRNRYEGAVIAVARNGERLPGKLGDIALRPGDTLLIEADPGFAERHRNNRDFLLVSALDDSAPRRHDRAPIAIAILAGMVFAASVGWVDMLTAALVASGLMIAARCCTVAEARRSVDWPVLLVIGATLGIGKALDTTGAAGAIAGAVLAVAGQHPWLALLAVYALTSFFTEIITNNAAVALVFPIAHETAVEMDVSFMPFVIAVMMAGSASFATPLGYQTNLMVYGPGGYRFTDFLRIGVPMNLLMAASVVALTPFAFPF